MKFSPFWIQDDQPAPADSPTYSNGLNTIPFRTTDNAEGVNKLYIDEILRRAASTIPCLTPIILTPDQRAARLTQQQKALSASDTIINNLEQQRRKLTTDINAEKDKIKKRKLMTDRRVILNKKKDQTTLYNKISNDIRKLKNTAKDYQDGNIKDPSNPVVVQTEECTYGYLLYLESTKGTSIPSAEQSAIVTELMDILDDRLRTVYYKGLTDTDGALTLTPSPAFPPVPVLDTMMRLSLFDLEFIGTDPQNKNADIITALKLRIGSGKAWDETNGFPFRFFYRANVKPYGWCLWVPKTMPNVYTEPNDTDYYYSPSGTAGAYTRNDKGGASVLACYAIDNAGIIQPVPARGESVRSGAGGGAMRADKVIEADYKWSGNKALGYALNLDMEAYIPPTLGGFNFAHALDWVPTPDGYQKAQTPVMLRPSTDVSGSMNSEIIYFKKFKDPVVNKKNTPKSTIPLASSRFQKSGGVVDLVKKKKGSWEFGGGVFGKTGEVLKHMNADRESAGAVMRDAFNDMKFTVTGTDLGSATQFANWVAQNDKKASDHWASTSAGVQLYSGQDPATLAGLKKQIRTNQEWCHLFGHGDGGSEELGNFISGSKHCNTEQLAIETGQRYQKYEGLTVKITGYLMPNDGFNKTAFTKSDLEYLKNLDQSTVNLNNQPAAALAIKNYVDQYPNLDALAYLPSLPGAIAGPVPTKEAYAIMPARVKRRVMKDLYQKFRSILTLHYPLGIYVRYKIYDGGTKIFDHTFSAQSESFDLNQFNILTHTVKRVIATSKDEKDEFVEAVNMKLKARLQGETVQKYKDMFATSGYEIK